MTTRPKKKKKAAKAAKKSAKKKSVKKAAAKKSKAKKTLKARGKKAARLRTVAPKASSPPKRAAQRRRALLSVSGRRAKSVPSRGPARGRVMARPRIMKAARGAPRVDGVKIKAPLGSRYTEVLTPAALRFLADLHREFEAGRERILAARAEQQERYDAGELPDFRPGTKVIRDDEDWRVAPIPEDLADRRVEITGPVDRKMIINALNCGANVFMADFEDANSPTWANNIEGQINLKDRWAGKLSFTDPETKKRYQISRQAGRADRAPARLASCRRARHRRRRADLGIAVRFRPLLLPQREGADRRRHRTLFLSAEARDARGSAAVERGVRVRAGAARHSERHDPRDRADRDAARRIRDGGNPLRAARPHRGAQCRPLGFHFLLHQEARQAQGLHPPRSRRRW